MLTEDIRKEFRLDSTPRALQLGVRVEDQINEQYEKIIKANYDFKFIKNYTFDNGVNIRIRTFCCNSGNAHVCEEINKEGFTCFNGHAYKTPDPNNHTVNYGIICEIKGLGKYENKEEQIQLMKEVNSLPEWREDNDLTSPKRNLLDGFEHLRGLYPDEVIDAMTDFIKELNKIVDLSKAKYFYPEIKLSGMTPKLDEHFETQSKNLYMIGDCAYSRGIVKASLMGMMLADYLYFKRK